MGCSEPVDKRRSYHRIPCFNRQVQTFETFRINAGNRLAHSMLRTTTEQPLESYNPLYIHGAPRTGKSHLLKAAAELRREAQPNAGVHLINCDPNDFEPMLQDFADFDLVLVGYRDASTSLQQI